MMNSSLNSSLNPSLNPSLSYHGVHAAPLPVAVQDDEASLGSYLETLFDQRRILLLVALIGALAGLLVSWAVRPVYESNLLIHVEENSTKEAKNILGELGAMFEAKTSAAAEMELLRSRLVVARAIDNLRLYIDARPHYFPLIGAWIAHHHKGLSAPGLFGYGGYTWGTEKIDVSLFNVPDSLQNLDFQLTAEANGTYRLRQPERDITLQGKVGVPLEADTEFGPLNLLVAELDGRPGAKFHVRRSSRLSAIENVQKGLLVTEQGKQSGVIAATLQGDDPSTVGRVLSEIGAEYILQNGFRKTEEALKSLTLLERQMPGLKQQLELAEARLNQFRNQHGTVDLPEEARISLQSSAAARLRKLDLEQKRSELLNRFTSDHPAVIGINSQLREINAEIRSSNEHIRSLPALEQEVLRLSRDVKVNSDLYTALLNTAQQLRLVTLGKGSNVRLVDNAMMPEKPVSPNRPKLIALGLVLGLLAGILLIFARKALRGGIEDPAEIEKMLGLPVFATIPHSKMQSDLFQNAGETSKRLPLLARTSSTDVAIESLRNFRASLQFSLGHARNNVVLVAGPAAGTGKTFVSVNLAALLAASGKRVMLVDADFRNGHLHRYFELGRHTGLSDYLNGSKTIEQAINRNVLDKLDFISTGSLPPNPSELLLRPRFGELLANLAAQYDVVLIDATPILPVADTLIIGAHAGSIYLMSRAGLTTPGELSESIKRLLHAGLVPTGVVFNDLKLRPGRYGYGNKYGRYRTAAPGPAERPMIEVAPA